MKISNLKSALILGAFALTISYAGKQVPTALAIEDETLANKYMDEHPEPKKAKAGIKKMVTPALEKLKADLTAKQKQKDEQRMNELHDALKANEKEHEILVEKRAEIEQLFSKKNCKAVIKAAKGKPSYDRAKECLELRSKIEGLNADIAHNERQARDYNAEVAYLKYGGGDTKENVDTDVSSKNVEAPAPKEAKPAKKSTGIGGKALHTPKSSDEEFGWPTHPKQ